MRCCKAHHQHGAPCGKIFGAHVGTLPRHHPRRLCDDCAVGGRDVQAWIAAAVADGLLVHDSERSKSRGTSSGWTCGMCSHGRRRAQRWMGEADHAVTYAAILDEAKAAINTTNALTAVKYTRRRSSCGYRRCAQRCAEVRSIIMIHRLYNTGWPVFLYCKLLYCLKLRRTSGAAHNGAACADGFGSRGCDPFRADGSELK